MFDALFTPLRLGDIELQNRFVMAPMTRSRANPDDSVSALHVEYYAQRASAGLIISEGIHPSPAGKGYTLSPGLYSDEQQLLWRAVTDAVHEKDGRIVAQIMHCGRVGHPDNKAPGSDLIGPSAIPCQTEIYTPKGMQPMPTPRAIEGAEIPGLIREYCETAERAIAAGFDGIELHCTSGYLPAQFLSTGSNQRSDNYGGSLDNRLRFVLELTQALCDTVGAGRVGLRVCPGNPFNDLQDEDPSETFGALFRALSPMGLAYLHVIRMASTGIDNIALAQQHFKGALIVNDSYSPEEADQLLADQGAAAVSFGRAFIANPDFVERVAKGTPLSRMNGKTLYTPGPAGYIDYPTAEQASLLQGD
jgi:N-ethylmaleimide reductase|tara:strand:- start:219 stop:1304 length:1086 start_codon:yes stop_codon:yes gene_type:complete